MHIKLEKWPDPDGGAGSRGRRAILVDGARWGFITMERCGRGAMYTFHEMHTGVIRRGERAVILEGERYTKLSLEQRLEEEAVRRKTICPFFKVGASGLSPLGIVASLKPSTDPVGGVWLS